MIKVTVVYMSNTFHVLDHVCLHIVNFKIRQLFDPQGISVILSQSMVLITPGVERKLQGKGGGG